jgi:putative ABC transport system substrate-binding protein
MKRRDFIALLGGAATVWSLAARAQPAKKIPRVGVLWHAGCAVEEDVYLSVVTKAFSDLGYVDGKTIQLEHRFTRRAARPVSCIRPRARRKQSGCDHRRHYAGGKRGQAGYQHNSDRICSRSRSRQGGAGRKLGTSGGNDTGFSLLAIDLSGKRLELFRELVPNLSRMAVMLDPRDGATSRIRSGYDKAAQALGISLQTFEVTTPDEIEQAFAAISRDGFNGVTVTGPLLFNERVRIGASALKYKVPAMTVVAEMVPDGLLLSYGQDIPDFFRRSAACIDKILKGAKPADLPVEQPTHFKL